MVAGYGFGAKYARRMTVRWLNVGSRGPGASRDIAGQTVSAPLFRVCRGCGVQDRVGNHNRPQEHRAWCRYRHTHDEDHVETVALSRTLQTQGVMLTLPWSVTVGDVFAVPSLSAAILLGLRETFGGSPDHIGVDMCPDPSLEGENRSALLLHDRVPGGTGYLADLARPEQVWQLLQRAYAVVSECECASEGRQACHRCLLPFTGTPELVARATAERHLRDILTSGNSEGNPLSDMGWIIEPAQPVPSPGPVPASPLEKRFFEAFVRMADTLSARVKQKPGPAGNKLTITVGNSPRTWFLEPQVAVAGSRPDFVLTCSDTTVPPVAIFTDGYAYHATATHNRLADDARKRQDLRDGGYLVLAVTEADVRDELRGAPRSVPAWWNRTTGAALVATPPAASAAMSAALAGPFAILREWLQNPNVRALEELSGNLPMLFLAPPVTVDSQLPLTEQVRRRLGRGTAAIPGSRQAVGGFWQHGHTIIGVRHSGRTVEACLLIDDGESALRDTGFHSDWRAWLDLSNALQLRPGVVIGTTSTVIEDRMTPSPAPRSSTTLPAEWEQIREGADEQIKSLVEELFRKAVPLPEAGEEIVELGLLTDLTWPDRKIAVISDPLDEDFADLARLGWTLIGVDAEAIVRAVNEEVTRG